MKGNTQDLFCVLYFFTYFALFRKIVLDILNQEYMEQKNSYEWKKHDAFFMHHSNCRLYALQYYL